MIVVDTNIIHYCWVADSTPRSRKPSDDKTPTGTRPTLWRSELRNVLTAYLRRESLSREHIVEILDAADHALAGNEHIIADQLVLDVVEASTLTAYDAEFVALASALSVPLVTADKAVLEAFPDRAMTMEAFVSR